VPPRSHRHMASRNILHHMARYYVTQPGRLLSIDARLHQLRRRLLLVSHHVAPSVIVMSGRPSRPLMTCGCTPSKNLNVAYGCPTLCRRVRGKAGESPSARASHPRRPSPCDAWRCRRESSADAGRTSWSRDLDSALPSLSVGTTRPAPANPRGQAPCRVSDGGDGTLRLPRNGYAPLAALRQVRPWPFHAMLAPSFNGVVLQESKSPPRARQALPTRKIYRKRPDAGPKAARRLEWRPEARS